MIEYHEAYEIWSPEDVEAGEPADTGFAEENAQATFREMVKLLSGTTPSCQPIPTNGASRIFYTGQPERDYRTGAEELHTFLPADDRANRYMQKAWLTANK